MIEKNHPPIKYGNTGVLVINLGTPDSTKWLDIRKYLKEFLSDRRVIEVNPIIWQIILNLFILNFKNSSEISAASGVVLDSSAKREFNENYIKAKSLLELFK